MEMRELRYFVQIAKDRSYTKAAEHLYVSQPALSKTIKKLEDELSIPLFDTRRSGVWMTDYGEMLYSRVVPLLNDFDALSHFVDDVSGIQAGKLRVGTTPMLGTLFMVDIVVAFCNQYPNIELKLVENGSKVLRHSLLEGDIDIGLCISGDENSALEDIVLFQDEMVVCMAENNPLAQYPSLQFEQLKDSTFNFYSSASTLHSQITDRCIRAGFEPKINISSTKVGMIMQMTAKQKGICILPRPYAAQCLLQGLVLVPLTDPFPWSGCLVRNKMVYQSYTCGLFQSFVIEHFKTNLSLVGLPFSSFRIGAYE